MFFGLFVHIKPPAPPQIEKDDQSGAEKGKQQTVVEDKSVNPVSVYHFLPSMMSIVWTGSSPSHQAWVGGVIRVPFVMRY